MQRWGGVHRLLTGRHCCRELTVRQAHTENLCVCNWLNKGQVLVTSVVVAGDMQNCTAVAVPPHLDIPPLADKPCKLSITPYKAGKVNMSVYFKNQATEEYVFYKLELDVKEAGPVETAVLATPVRCKASWETRIKNPLDSKLLLTGACTTSILSFPRTVELEPHDEAAISIGFMPLLVSEQEAVLTYTCPDIGQYQYNLKLVGQKSPAQGTIQFKVPLGASETKTFQFTNLHPEKCDYAASIEKDGALAFSTAQSVTAAGGESVEASVTFQPTSVGETHSTLTLSSPTGGEFVWVLRGIATEPMPQGPVKVNKTATIPFTNPFLQVCTACFMRHLKYVHECTRQRSVDGTAMSSSDTVFLSILAVPLICRTVTSHTAAITHCLSSKEMQR